MALPGLSSAASSSKHEVVTLPRERLLFLDRDGVLVVPEFRAGRSYAPTSLDTFSIYPDARSALDSAISAGFRIVVVTNQPDVGNGRIDRSIVEEMHDQLRKHLPIELIKTCFHRQDEGCECRKPCPGMLLEAASELDLDASQGFMVGDRASDVEAGLRAGCRCVFIDRFYTAERAPSGHCCTVTTLAEAIDWIVLQTTCESIMG